MFCIEPSFKKYLFEIAAWGYFSEAWGQFKTNNNNFGIRYIFGNYDYLTQNKHAHFSNRWHIFMVVPMLHNDFSYILL